jgi:predicted negative regulator of RcsB-dependent stress response
MIRTPVGITLLAIALLVLAAGCSREKEVSPLFILEELEAATARSDPEERIEQLEIFAANHADHPYGAKAYERILDVMTSELDDPERAWEYFDGLMDEQTDPKIRGSLCYRKFAYLWKADKEQALAYIDELVEGPESHYRLFLYISYYLVWSDDYAENAALAERVLDKAIASAGTEYESKQAVAVLGALKDKIGATDEAFDILSGIAGTPDADEVVGRILWERGDREEALETYIRYTAVIPGAREHLSLDSLYALVYPGSDDLAEKIWDARILEGVRLEDHEFVDIEGKSYRLGDYDDVTLVINLWQPT